MGTSVIESGLRYNRRMIQGAFWMVLSLLVLFTVFEPLTSQFQKPLPGWSPGLIGAGLPLPERIRLGIITFLVAGWCFAVGASIGSFLNVVVYRLPLGKSVTIRRSHCPRCLARIRITDNIPLVGWLRLKGRCRNCRLPISTRYPLVEVACGLLFLLVFQFEVLSAGRNLPLRPPGTFSGVINTILYPQAGLIFPGIFHACLLAFILTWSLFLLDRSKIPVLFSLFSVVLFLSLMIASRELIQARVSVGGGFATFPLSIPESILAVAAGGVGGLLTVGLASWICRTFNARADSLHEYWTGWFTGTIVTGMVMGWQFLIASMTITMLVIGVGRVVGLNIRRNKWGLYFLAASTGHLVLWRSLSRTLSLWWISDWGSLWSVFIWLTALAGLFWFVESTDVGEIGGIGENEATMDPVNLIGTAEIDEATNIVEGEEIRCDSPATPSEDHFSGQGDG